MAMQSPSRSRSSRWLHLRAAVVVAGLALAALPSVALAHARLVRSTPSDSSSVANSPTELRLTFSEKVERAMSRVKLLGPNGKEVALAPLTDGGDAGKTMVAAVRSTLAPGTYTVTWQVAGRDGHPVRGQFTFTVGGAAPTAGGQTSATDSSGAHAGHGAAHTAPAGSKPAGSATPAAGRRPPASRR